MAGESRLSRVLFVTCLDTALVFHTRPSTPRRAVRIAGHAACRAGCSPLRARHGPAALRRTQFRPSAWSSSPRRTSRSSSLVSRLPCGGHRRELVSRGHPKGPSQSPSRCASTPLAPASASLFASCRSPRACACSKAASATCTAPASTADRRCPRSCAASRCSRSPRASSRAATTCTASQRPTPVGLVRSPCLASPPFAFLARPPLPAFGRIADHIDHLGRAPLRRVRRGTARSPAGERRRVVPDLASGDERVETPRRWADTRPSLAASTGAMDLARHRSSPSRWRRCQQERTTGPVRNTIHRAPTQRADVTPTPGFDAWAGRAWDGSRKKTAEARTRRGAARSVNRHRPHAARRAGKMGCEPIESLRIGMRSRLSILRPRQRRVSRHRAR